MTISKNNIFFNELPTFRDHNSSGPLQFGTRGYVSGARYRQFGNWIPTVREFDKNEILRF